MATEDSTTVIPFIGKGRAHKVTIDVDEYGFEVTANKEKLIDLGLIREQTTSNGQKRLYVTAKTNSRNYFTRGKDGTVSVRLWSPRPGEFTPDGFKRHLLEEIRPLLRETKRKIWYFVNGTEEAEVCGEATMWMSEYDQQAIAGTFSHLMDILEDAEIETVPSYKPKLRLVPEPKTSK